IPIDRKSFRSGKRCEKETTTVSWEPECKCGADVVPCTVLDMFAGSGTTGEVAVKNRRKVILIDRKPEYAEMQKKRASGIQLNVL
ncbi:MAG: hypothetical protein KAJ19_30080, partial [Gammaproteobacteria bacterium]|nr:hypothetical protein [Gammaproteobacteria bacterium]